MPNTRITDPITSQEAASTVRNLTDTMRGIVEILRKHVELTDTEIKQHYNWDMSHGKYPWASDSGLRSRRSELVDLGIVEASGNYGKTPSGRRTIVWRLVAEK